MHPALFSHQYIIIEVISVKPKADDVHYAVDTSCSWLEISIEDQIFTNSPLKIVEIMTYDLTNSNYYAEKTILKLIKIA